MAGKKAKSVSVVGMEGVPLERVLGEQVGAGLQQALTENQKLHFYMKAGITKIQGSGAAESVVIKLDDGSEKTLPAQIVLLGVGVAPATEFLKDSKGFPALAKDGSVHVNADLSVKGLEGKGVYAAGDIASTPERTGSGEMRIEHWNVSDAVRVCRCCD
jgi:thioredoxin reductase